MRTRAISPVILVCALAGCAPRQSADTRPSGSGSAIVIPSSEISGSALQAIRTRIPSARISTTGACPRIAFRGTLSLNNQPDPSVYIDGTMMGDTCSLTNVSGSEIERIEVYPSGDTPDATIRRNPAGVILIFRRRE